MERECIEIRNGDVEYVLLSELTDRDLGNGKDILTLGYSLFRRISGTERIILVHTFDSKQQALKFIDFWKED